jgi:hypothetical protein
MIDLPTPPSPFPDLPPWSGVGADGWDGTVGADDLRLISASSVPKALASPALERWAISRTIEMLAERLPQFQALVAQDIDAAVKWADQLRYEPEAGAELNAADSGSLIHALLECWLRGTQVDPRDAERVQRDPVLLAMATQCWGWFNNFQPEAVDLERVVYDPAAGIAGRFDAIVRFRKAPHLGTCLMDLKTTRTPRYKSGALKRVYGDSHALQLASYRYAPLMATFEPRLLRTERASATRVYLLNTAEREACAPMHEIDSTVIVSNSPEKCSLHVIDTGPAVRRRVLEAVGLHQWIHVESKNVVADAWVPPIDLPLLGGNA